MNFSPALKKWGLYWILVVCHSVCRSVSLSVIILFPLNILRNTLKNLTKFCMCNIDMIYLGIVTHNFWNICNRVTALDLCRNFFAAQYLENYLTYFPQGGYSYFFCIRRLRHSIYHSPQKNIRNFKHPKKIFEILATQKMQYFMVNKKKNPLFMLGWVRKICPS